MNISRFVNAFHWFTALMLFTANVMADLTDADSSRNCV